MKGKKIKEAWVSSLGEKYGTLLQGKISVFVTFYFPIYSYSKSHAKFYGNAIILPLCALVYFVGTISLLMVISIMDFFCSVTGWH
jgi:hypothetical protein